MVGGSGIDQGRLCCRIVNMEEDWLVTNLFIKGNASHDHRNDFQLVDASPEVFHVPVTGNKAECS